MSEDESASKRPKLNYEEEPNRNAEPIAGPSNEQPHPEIFKLDIDCFDEIFEYLSLNDLHSFGRTCKTTQQVAGEYFKRNYSAAESFIESRDIYMYYLDKSEIIKKRTSVSGFSKFITCMKYNFHNIETLRQIHQKFKGFDSIRQVRLMNQPNFDEESANYFKMIWPNVETVKMQHCRIRGDFHEHFLVHCNNLKRLYLDLAYPPQLHHNVRVPWFRRQYPKLEHFGLYRVDLIDELNEFFRNNANINIFSIDGWSLLRYKDQLMELNVQLECLKVESSYICGPNVEMSSLLRALHERGIFKSLYFYSHSVHQQCIHELISMPALEGLCIRLFTETFDLAQLSNLRELAILHGANAKDMHTLVKSLGNLQRIYIGNATINDILPFICHAPKVTKIKITLKDEADFNREVLRLQTLNKERGKLNGAKKVTIYVPDNIFLKTKWASKHGDTNLSLIEMVRSDSYEWDPTFY